VVGLGLGGGATGVLDMVGAGQWLGAPGASCVAVLLGMVGFAMARRGEQSQAGPLVDKISGQIDHIMIGAAETSFFVDTIKTKIGKDVVAADRIAASAEQNAATTEQIAANAERASSIAAEVRTESVSGRSEVDRGLQQIGQARTDALSASSMMAQLQEKSRRIHGITEVISEIAARTNLLALNAAIEAARAGEQGRGFAVVADEVRKLAERTAKATTEISGMIHGVQSSAQVAVNTMQQAVSRVGNGVGMAQNANTSMLGINDGAQRVVSAVNEISHALKEQSIASNEIAANVERIAQMAEENSSATRTAADSAHRLEALSDETLRAVSYFRV
jgi:methyl-accepting chemotaxis protein